MARLAPSGNPGPKEIMNPEDRKPVRAEPEDGFPLDEPPEEELHLSSDMERAAAIASVMRHQALQKEALTQVRIPGKRALLPQLLTLAASTAFAVYIWFGSPAWLEMDPIPLPPKSVEEDVVRSAVLLQVERIQSYRETNGRLPAFLEEAGPRLPGVEYRRLDNRTYRLNARGERVIIHYRSGQPLDEFQESLQALLGSGTD